MALATQCPHCHTTFRVAHDQLKLRAGLVRCGACKQIFNGIENLLQPEQLEQTVKPVPAPRPEIPAPEPKPVLPQADFYIDFPDEEDEAVSEEHAAKPSESASTFEEGTPPADAEPEPRKDDPLLRMTLMDFAYERREPAADNAPPSQEEPEDSIEQAIDDLENKPWRRELDASELSEGDALDRAEAAEYEIPSFVKQGRRKQRMGRALYVVMAVGSVILFIALLAQSAYVFRDQIAAWVPKAKPALATICVRIGCQVGLPAQIESVSIESSELQTVAPDSSTFALTILLRNHGTTDQAWPNIELTLNDNTEKPVARRVFVPREYLPTAIDTQKGFPAKSEQPLKLFLELAQLKASGYRVYLFYP